MKYRIVDAVTSISYISPLFVILYILSVILFQFFYVESERFVFILTVVNDACQI